MLRLMPSVKDNAPFSSTLTSSLVWLGFKSGTFVQLAAREANIVAAITTIMTAVAIFLVLIILFMLI